MRLKLRNPTLAEDIVLTMPIGVAIFNKDLIVEWINENISSLYGLAPQECIGRQWLELVPATEERRQIYARVLAGEGLDYPEARSPLGEEERCFDLRYRPIRDDTGEIRGMLAACLEITDRKRVEHKLMESEQKLRKISDELDRMFALSPDMICMANYEGYYKRLNAAFARTLGHSEAILMNEPYLNFIHPEDRERTRGEIACCMAGTETVRFENRYRCHDGTYKSIAWRAVSEPQEELIYAVARDMTDIRAAQHAAEKERSRAERLRSLYVKEVLSAQEEERRRIGRELHDETGSALTSLLIGLRSVSQQDLPAEARERLTRLQEIAESTVDSISRVAHGLHPSALEDLGFRAAVERYAAEYSEVNTIKVHLIIKPNAAVDDLPLSVTTTLYRIIQEALANVAKHAEAKNVSVIVDSNEETLKLIIEDDGRGFPESTMEDSDASSGIGIQGIRERLALLGGALTIESIFAGGTTLFAQVPRLQDAPREEDPSTLRLSV